MRATFCCIHGSFVYYWTCVALRPFCLLITLCSHFVFTRLPPNKLLTNYNHRRSDILVIAFGIFGLPGPPNIRLRPNIQPQAVELPDVQSLEPVKGGLSEPQQPNISWSCATPWMLEEALHVAERRKGSSLPVLDVCAPDTLSRQRFSPPALLPGRPVQTGDFLEWTNRSVVCVRTLKENGEGEFVHFRPTGRGICCYKHCGVQEHALPRKISFASPLEPCRFRAPRPHSATTADSPSHECSQA